MKPSNFALATAVIAVLSAFDFGNDFRIQLAESAAAVKVVLIIAGAAAFAFGDLAAVPRRRRDRMLSDEAVDPEDYDFPNLGTMAFDRYADKCGRFKYDIHFVVVSDHTWLYVIPKNLDGKKVQDRGCYPLLLTTTANTIGSRNRKRALLFDTRPKDYLYNGGSMMVGARRFKEIARAYKKVTANPKGQRGYNVIKNSCYVFIRNFMKQLKLEFDDLDYTMEWAADQIMKGRNNNSGKNVADMVRNSGVNVPKMLGISTEDMDNDEMVVNKYVEYLAKS